MTEWDPIVRRVLAGQVKPEDLPEIPQRIVRVFLSSTGIGRHAIFILCSYILIINEFEALRRVYIHLSR